MTDLRIETEELGDEVVVIGLDGVLDKRSSGSLEQKMRELADDGRLKFVIDCRGLTHLSSDGMGVFLSHLIKIRKAGGDIKFCHMRDEVQSVLQMLGLGKLLVVKDSRDEAVQEFAEGDGAGERQKASQTKKLRVEAAVEQAPAGDVTVIALHGFVDRHTISLLDGELAACLERGQARIVIDCAELTYISSNGMGVFISYVSKARSQDGDIRLCNLRDVARTVITMLGLHRHFEVFESRAAAVASYT